MKTLINATQNESRKEILFFDHDVAIITIEDGKKISKERLFILSFGGNMKTVAQKVQRNSKKTKDPLFKTGNIFAASNVKRVKDEVAFGLVRTEGYEYIPKYVHKEMQAKAVVNAKKKTPKGASKKKGEKK